MLVGVPKEIKDSEYRVGLVPSTAGELIANGHRVIVERGAGIGAGLGDADYEAVGAEIVPSADEIYARAELVVKVKEPLAEERKKLRPGQVLFTYLHLAADRAQTNDLLASGATAIAYETVTSPQGALPLLTPMSEVAGRMAPHVGARCLEKENGGRGVLLGGVPGVPSADVVVLGGGVAGSHAALIAAGMGATVTVVDRNLEALRRISNQLGTRIRTVWCAATSRPTTHSAPTYTVDEVVHYCVTNMPGAVARTSTFALNNVTLPFVLALADKGVRRALGEDPHLRNGLNVYEGKLTHRAVAQALGLSFTRPEAALRL
jgi:alanine dehydrogenase